MENSRADLLNAYIQLMGSDAEEKGFYQELAFLTEGEIVSKIIECAQFYQNEYNK